MATCRKRARDGALRNVVCGELGEPGGRAGKVLDQIGASEGGDNRWFSGGDELADELALLGRKADVALAVGHAHENGGNGDVVGIGGRKLKRGDGGIFCIGPESDERIGVTPQSGLDGFARVGIGVGGKGDEQDALRARGVQRQKLWRVA